MADSSSDALERPPSPRAVPTLRAPIEAYLCQRYGPGARSAHGKHVRAVLTRFADSAGTTPLRYLSRRKVEAWLASRDSVAAVTLRGELSMVRSLCAWMKDEGMLGRDPCARLHLPTGLETFKAKPRRHTVPVVGLREQLLAEGLAPITVALYYRVILDAEAFCQDRSTTLATAPIDVLAKYVAARPATFSTRKAMRSALKHYWEIKGRSDPPLKLLRLPPRPRMVCRALDVGEAAQLCKAAWGRSDDPGLAVCLGLYQGLRRAEIAGLRWENFDDEGWLTVAGKGGLVATIPVYPIVTDLLRHKQRSSPFLFPGPKGGAGHAYLHLAVGPQGGRRGRGEKRHDASASPHLLGDSERCDG